jgi:OOP family OmpA-OmpF porin
MKKLAQFMIAVCMGLMATACAHKNMPAPFAPTDLNSKVGSGEYVQKIDNFLVIFDDTASMHLDRQWQCKLGKAKVVANNMNNTIPALNLQAGMRAFGPKNYSMADGSALQHGMTVYNKTALGETINSVMTTGGNTPLARTFDLANADLAKTKGDIAVIVISDGEENIGGSAVKAAKDLKDKYKDRLCIYTILIGDSPAGRATMEQIAKASECGFATDEAAVSTPEGMASFVEKVFLKTAEKCVTPQPAPVLEKKCFSIELKVEFAFDKSKVREEYFKTLTEFADLVRAYPNHTVNLEGHTCNIGTDKYNMKLGQRRADSVRNFILKHFKDIDPARLTAISYGEAKPIANNDKKDERPHNRRVFATFTYCDK